jgi:streptogramin lyase
MSIQVDFNFKDLATYGCKAQAQTRIDGNQIYVGPTDCVSELNGKLWTTEALSYLVGMLQPARIEVKQVGAGSILMARPGLVCVWLDTAMRIVKVTKELGLRIDSNKVNGREFRQQLFPQV